MPGPNCHILSENLPVQHRGFSISGFDRTCHGYVLFHHISLCYPPAHPYHHPKLTNIPLMPMGAAYCISNAGTLPERQQLTHCYTCYCGLYSYNVGMLFSFVDLAYQLFSDCAFTKMRLQIIKYFFVNWIQLTALYWKVKGGKRLILGWSAADVQSSCWCIQVCHTLSHCALPLCHPVPLPLLTPVIGPAVCKVYWNDVKVQSLTWTVLRPALSVFFSSSLPASGDHTDARRDQRGGVQILPLRR